MDSSARAVQGPTVDCSTNVDDNDDLIYKDLGAGRLFLKKI